ncbi:DUF1800 family protein [Massilia sp. MS-15]|uniref:DUF1800 domain-containing protein n=1 Tax=Massilia sp. MS-15 TaxID=2878200 RepID=UPI001CD7E101|nr:DUF1800 domain-containing protein [Massilia sp. MS-15]MCA1248152.1 DUF1800 domain-containing protein [Massilia sp. MS-15]
MPTFLRLSRARAWLIPAVLLLAAGCSRDAGQPAEAFSASAGQVKPVATTPVTRYAAARFADQVSFGATPELVAEIQAKGFERWIDDQFALPVSLIDTSPIAVYDDQIREQADFAYRHAGQALYKSFLDVPDQLRRRVSWALSQFVVASIAKVQPYGGLSYSNFLQKQAFGNYGELIRAVTMNPAMGVYLDNLENRPTSDECRWCAPNENYARELMQLFTLGVVKLNLDGTIQRDETGKPVETYSQKDVEELARALTGWRMDGNFDRTDYRRYDGELIPDPWRAAHDRGAKVVLGRSFPAGGEARQELDTIVSVLMTHQNIAPFVSLRLIQHLVTSDPSPAYIARVATVFRDNGQGVAGDMKAVVKAVLLDPEARRGDQPGTDSPQFGKMREPLLWYTGLMRGLGCKRGLKWNAVDVINPPSQRPFDASSVFSYYLPTDRAPGSNLLAPEQRLLTSEELSWRLRGGLNDEVKRAGTDCDPSAFSRAFSSSPSAFADLVSERYFRGAMPATLRQNLIDLAPTTWGNTPDDKALSLLQFALATPYYGVIR